jgi:thioredoxin-like negative regulator of GroEL
VRNRRGYGGCRQGRAGRGAAGYRQETGASASAWTAAQSTNKPILVYVTSRSCPHCTRMLGETLKASSVQRFVCDSFETVYVDRSEQPELAAKLNVRMFPTTLVVGPDNQVIDMIEGYVDAAAFSRRLQTTLAAQADGTTTR